MNKIVIISGPTAVGKTDYAIAEALRVGSPVVSCDSRQLYRELRIGVARPDEAQLAAVQHYFIADRSIAEPCSAGAYELEALRLLEKLFRDHETVVMAGGSGLYIDALCNGLDDFPEADPELREQLSERLRTEGVAALRADLRILDPESYAALDPANGQRIVKRFNLNDAKIMSMPEFQLQQNDILYVEPNKYKKRGVWSLPPVYTAGVGIFGTAVSVINFVLLLTNK